MGDCYVDSYAEAGKYRAVVIQTATGRQLYVTWPYAGEQAAIARARRWIREERQRAEAVTLF